MIKHNTFLICYTLFFFFFGTIGILSWGKSWINGQFPSISHSSVSLLEGTSPVRFGEYCFCIVEHTIYIYMYVYIYMQFSKSKGTIYLLTKGDWCWCKACMENCSWNCFRRSWEPPHISWVVRQPCDGILDLSSGQNSQEWLVAGTAIQLGLAIINRKCRHKASKQRKKLVIKPNTWQGCSIRYLRSKRWDDS